MRKLADHNDLAAVGINIDDFKVTLDTPQKSCPHLLYNRGRPLFLHKFTLSRLLHSKADWMSPIQQLLS